jgi:prophage DNA circulation protein
MIDYKLYLVGVFAMMWHAYGATVGPIWAEKSDWVGEYVRDAWATFDKDAVQQLNQDIKVNEQFLQSKAAFQDIFASVDDVSVAQAAALNLEHQNNFHRAIQKKLDALAALNESTTASIRTDMIQTVKAGATETLLNDEEVQADAFNLAIHALYHGKRQRDIVGEVYLGEIEYYRESLEDEDHPVHTIAAHVKAEIENITEAPDVIARAGNVYETHPVL